jgi:hypothetical protein
MNRMLGCLLLSVAIIGCDSTGPKIDDNADDSAFPGITVTNPAPIEYGRDTIDIQPEGPGGVSGMRSVAARSTIPGGDGGEYNIVQVAHIPAPEIAARDNATVQANDIIVDQSGHNAYIAYNYQGDPWMGALQIVDVRDKDAPVITTEIQFAHQDINALDLDGNDLMIAGAADPAVSGSFRSFVTRLNLQTLDVTEMSENVVGLPSYASTGVARHSNRYYVGVGALNGSIQMLDMDLNPVGEWTRGDIRDVDHFDGGVIALAGNTDSGVNTGDVIIARTTAFESPTVITIPGFGSDYHKATIEVWDGTHALLGMSEAGWGVIDLRGNGDFLYEETNPDGEMCELGGGPLLCNTNSVSTDGNLLFTANGQYGFRVFSPKNKNQFDDYELIGYYNKDFDSSTVPLEEKYSANHVELKANYLFVASGPQGVYIYSLERRNPQG